MPEKSQALLDTHYITPKLIVDTESRRETLVGRVQAIRPLIFDGYSHMKCYLAKPGDVKKKWHVIDANNQVVGRLAVKIARILCGKHRPEYTPHIDTGDFVVVTNCEKVRLTGNKMDQKVYQHFTGYPDGRKVRPVREILAKRPEMVIREAVRRMMPKTNLARHMLSKLKVYAGPNHPHQAQQAVELKPEATW